jgi:PAS domain S-box-containing protein
VTRRAVRGAPLALLGTVVAATATLVATMVVVDHWGVPVVGMLLTVALGMLALAASRRERHAVALVDEHTAERSRVEAELRAAEQRHRLLADNATDTILMFGPDGRITYVSPACRDLIGHEPEDVVGRPPRDFVHPDDRREVNGARARVSKTGGTVTVTSRLQHREGHYVWI